MLPGVLISKRCMQRDSRSILDRMLRDQRVQSASLNLNKSLALTPPKP
jgi:hypothetical protein